MARSPALVIVETVDLNELSSILTGDIAKYIDPHQCKLVGVLFEMCL